MQHRGAGGATGERGRTHEAEDRVAPSPDPPSPAVDAGGAAASAASAAADGDRKPNNEQGAERKPALFVVETAPVGADTQRLFAKWLEEEAHERDLEPRLVCAGLLGEIVAEVGPGDVVLLILHRAQAEWELHGDGVPWERWAQVTEVLVERRAAVVLVTLQAQAAGIATCLARGAHAVVELNQVEEALEVVVSVLKGELDASELRSLFLSCPFLSPFEEEHLERLSHLTTIELRVLFYLTQGYAADHIGTVEWISLSTVRTHIRSIFRKLGVNSQVAAVAFANGTAASDVGTAEESTEVTGSTPQPA